MQHWVNILCKYTEQEQKISPSCQDCPKLSSLPFISPSLLPPRSSTEPVPFTYADGQVLFLETYSDPHEPLAIASVCAVSICVLLLYVIANFDPLYLAVLDKHSDRTANVCSYTSGQRLEDSLTYGFGIPTASIPFALALCDSHIAWTKGKERERERR